MKNSVLCLYERVQFTVLITNIYLQQPSPASAHNMGNTNFLNKKGFITFIIITWVVGHSLIYFVGDQRRMYLRKTEYEQTVCNIAPYKVGESSRYG